MNEGHRIRSVSKVMGVLAVAASAWVALRVVAGNLEPASAPGPTMHTLEEIYQAIMARTGGVPKTGQTTSYATGDDGGLQKGVTWPSPRFTDNSDGTVTDNLTGLIWLKNANPAAQLNWVAALGYCDALSHGDVAGLTDGSSDGDWRLPNVRELQSLIDHGRYSPALPVGHPFTGVQSDFYWSGTTYRHETDYACYVYVLNGTMAHHAKSNTNYVWPVRGGQ